MLRSCIFGKYSGSILGAYGMYGKRSGSMCLVLCAFGMKFWRCCVLYAFRTPRMDLEHDECFPKTCGKHAERVLSIRRVLKAFRKHTESVREGNLSKLSCGKYSVYSESILKPYWKHSENKRKAFGDTLGENTFGGTFGQFKKSHHFLILNLVRKTNGSSFRPVWWPHKIICIWQMSPSARNMTIW